MTSTGPGTEAEEPQDARASRSALREPEFRRYLASTFTLTTAMGVQASALGWQIYGLTGQKIALAYTGLAEALPAIAITLFAGHFADRRDRRRIVLGATVGLVLCSVAFLALARSAPEIPSVPAADRSLTASLALGPSGDPEIGTAANGAPPGGTRAESVPPPPLRVDSPLILAIYGVIVLTGLLRGVLGPSRTALGTDIVPREHLTAAINLRTTVWQAGMILGPPLGGISYWLGGATLAFGVDVVLLLVAFAAVRRMAPRPPKPSPAAAAEPLWSSLAVGIKFVRSRREILGALTLDLFAVLFGGVTAVLPVFAREILRVDALGFGVLRAAPSVGAVLLAWWIARREPFRKAGPTMLGAVAVFGAAMICFALSRSFVLSVLLLAISGAADYVSVVVRHTLLQTRTPVELLGRVSAVNAVFIGSSNEIGAFESGVAADWFGTVPSVVGGGCVTLLVVALTAWRFPELRRLGPLR